MADQLLKVREKVQEKLKKEAEVVVEIEQPSALQSATADYLSRKEEPHPLSSPTNLNEEQLDEFKKASVEFDRRNKSDMMKAKKDLEKKGHKVDVSGSMITVTAKRGSDIGREIKDVMNFYNGAKRAKALESVNGGKMSQLHMYIKQGKTAKEIGKLMGVDPKTIQKLMSAYDAKKIKEEMKIEAAIDEAKLIEKEKSVRQLIDPNKESMVMKKNKVIVIDKKDEDKYLKKGWALAEQDELQIKEWFKSKNIDVKVRQLDESTQVYVPIGRRIPNEIREELIITQYGKMPEDVKNVKDINYGNFMENSITMNNDFWTKVLHGTKGE